MYKLLLVLFPLLTGCSVFTAFMDNGSENDGAACQSFSNTVLRICGCDIPVRAYQKENSITVYEWDEAIWNKIETEEAARKGLVPSPPESIIHFNRACELIKQKDFTNVDRRMIECKPLAAYEEQRDIIKELVKAIDSGYCNTHRFVHDPCLHRLPCYLYRFPSVRDSSLLNPCRDGFLSIFV